jgi:hypothetical protein
VKRTIDIEDYEYKTEPYKHQAVAFKRSRDEVDFALLMEMGTGKTKVVIDTAAWLYAQGKLDFLLVVAPNEVHKNWILREMPVHLPDWCPARTAIWSSDMKAHDKKQYEKLWDAKFQGLRILAVNVEAFGVQERWWRAKRNGPKKFGTEVQRILDTFRTMFVVDESSKIKTPGARRTKRLWALGKRAKYRRIMTGTPITNSPLDLYAQFRFLNPEHLGFTNFFSFKHHFAEWRTERNWKTEKDYEVCTGYRNINELTEKMDSVSYRVTKKECLDLPEKMYVRRLVAMTDEQRRKYIKLRDDSLLELQDEEFKVANVLVKMLRLQQVLGGWLPNLDDPGTTTPLFENPKTNPRMKAVLDVAEETTSKIIIWARFRSEIVALTEVLNKEYGPGSAVPFYGDVKSADRNDYIDRFQGQRAIVDPVTHERQGWEDIPAEEQCRFFIAQQHSGGYGLTLTAASYVVYYSNDFSLEARLQSEDRCHRIGQKNPVTYIDLECLGTIDTRIITALRDKKKLADTITRDDVSSWL